MQEGAISRTRRRKTYAGTLHYSHKPRESSGAVSQVFRWPVLVLGVIYSIWRAYLPVPPLMLNTTHQQTCLPKIIPGTSTMPCLPTIILVNKGAITVVRYFVRLGSVRHYTHLHDIHITSCNMHVSAMASMTVEKVESAAQLLVRGRFVSLQWWWW